MNDCVKLEPKNENRKQILCDLILVYTFLNSYSGVVKVHIQESSFGKDSTDWNIDPHYTHKGYTKQRLKVRQ